jgi:hypothetical protein
MVNARNRKIAVAALSGVLAIAAVPLLLYARQTARSWTEGPPPAPPSGHAVILAELFTSEGCSSCPPADSVLSTLVREQPLPRVEVVGLSEHVTYWDHLGWRDPYSSDAFTNRQSEYDDRVFHGGSIYTPQLVIDGKYQAVGSDVAAIRNAIVKAAGEPKRRVTVSASLQADGRMHVRVQIDPQPGFAMRDRADIIVVVTEDGLTDDVARGENKGRRLTHSAVARTLTALGSIARGDEAYDREASFPLNAHWKRDAVRIVGFVQERGSRRILGAGSATLDDDLHGHTRREQ